MHKLVNSSWFTPIKSKFVVNSHKKTINYQPSTINRNSTGFTLIELLVVIAIIGILASLATYSYTDSQKKSRDSRRKSDLVAIQKALELAKQDTAGNYSYPRCITYGAPDANSCRIDDPGSSGSGNGPELIPATGTPYIKAVPKDPKSDAYYAYLPTPTTPCTAGNCTGFSLVACLENSKDPQKDEAQSGGSNNLTVCPNSGATAGTKSYTITNL